MLITSEATSYLGHALHLQAAWELGVVWIMCYACTVTTICRKPEELKSDASVYPSSRGLISRQKHFA